MRNVVVVESPTKAARMEECFSALGMADVEVLPTGGAVGEAELEGDSFVVRPLREKRAALERILSASRDARVFVATDSDREGEFAAMTVLRFVSGIAKEAYRSDLRSMRDSDIVNSMCETRALNAELACSAVLRAWFDKTTGSELFAASRGAALGPFPLGRVKAAVLGHLSGEPYSHVRVACPPRTGDVLCDLVETKNWSARAAYDEMRKAYEKGEVSYIRTDSCRIDKETLREFAAAVGWNGPLSPSEDAGKFVQDAHQCIYPFDARVSSPVVESSTKLLLESLTGEIKTFHAPLHTEQSVVRWMQEEGIARPSTYVSALEGVAASSYVSSDVRNASGAELRLAERGVAALEFVRNEFPFAEYCTIPMERALAELECGRKSMNETLAELRDIRREISRDFGGGVLACH